MVLTTTPPPSSASSTNSLPDVSLYPQRAQSAVVSPRGNQVTVFAQATRPGPDSGTEPVFDYKREVQLLHSVNPNNVAASRQKLIAYVGVDKQKAKQVAALVLGTLLDPTFLAASGDAAALGVADACIEAIFNPKQPATSLIMFYLQKIIGAKTSLASEIVAKCFDAYTKYRGDTPLADLDTDQIASLCVFTETTFFTFLNNIFEGILPDTNYPATLDIISLSRPLGTDGGTKIQSAFDYIAASPKEVRGITNVLSALVGANCLIHTQDGRYMRNRNVDFSLTSVLRANNAIGKSLSD